MRIAFTTSVMELGFAISTRSLWLWLSAVKGEPISQGEDKIINQLKSLREENKRGFEKSDGLVTAIEQSLVKSIENLIGEIRDVIVKELKKIND